MRTISKAILKIVTYIIMHLLYKVENCTSQHPNFPPTNLTTKHNHWQTERFSEYPVILTITFYQPALIKSIKIVSHPTKVASRVNILSYLPDLGDKGFEKLGFITFAQPESSNPLSQVKHINNIEKKAKQLRFIFLQNHPTTNNFFNQVGITLLEVNGDPIQHFIPQKMVKSQVIKGFEPQTTLLLQLKQSFVKKEQYQQAKQVRQIQLMLQRASKKIEELQQQKQKQVKLQNFQAAKLLKQEIIQVKSKVTDLTKKFLSYDGKSTMVKSDVNLFQKLQKIAISPKASSMLLEDKPVERQISPLRDTNEIVSENQDQDLQKNMNESMVSHEEKILPAVINRIRGMGQTQTIPEASQIGDNQFFEAEPKNRLPSQPQTLGPANEANSSLLLQFYEPIFIRKLYSKYWQFRLESVTKIIEELKANENAIFLNKNRFRCYIFIYLISLQIHNAKTTDAAFELMTLLAQSKTQGEEYRQWSKQLHNQLQAAVKATLQKAGDSNKKIKTHAQKTVIRMIQSKLIGISACYSGLIKSYPEKGASKLKKLRIQNLKYMVDKYGVGEGKVPLSIADFVFKAVADQQLQVRKSAVQLAKSIKSHGGKQKLQMLVGDSRISSSLAHRIE